MKIILIRHGKVNMEWEKTYDSKGFDEAQAKYDISPLLEYKGNVESSEGYKVYISKLIRTYDTALQVLSSLGEYEKTELLNEVPKRSYKDTDKLYPRFWWTLRSRMQWYFNDPRQPETRKKTKDRARKIADILEAEGCDLVVISHEFFLYTLKKELKRRGFSIRRGSTGRIKNWERIIASR